GSQVARAYGSTEVSERHRHRYEVNNRYRDTLQSAGLLISGTSPDGSLVEFVELDRALHPFAVATQAHPELKSRPTRPHPLFAAFVGAALDYLRSERLPIDDADQSETPGSRDPAGNGSRVQASADTVGAVAASTADVVTAGPIASR
ncbi:MAG TPA: hypothetical protein VIC62_19400, partial [Nakamurella sp.]